MNRNSRQFDRLLKAAAVRAPQTTEPAPYGFVTRVLASRADVKDVDEWLSLAPLFQRALVCAGLITLLCVAAAYRPPAPDDTDDLAIADAVIRMSLNQ